MRDFFKWFLSIGFKKYAIGYLLVNVVNYGFIDAYESITDNNVFIVILAHLVILAFNFGLTYHMITTYKKYKDSKKD